MLRDRGLVDKLVWASWDHEIESNPDVAEMLSGVNAIILALKPPSLKMTGHILHQMKTLLFGLKIFDDNEYVLKIRADLSNFSVSRMESLFKRYFEASHIDYLDWPHMFDEKIMIEGGFIYVPFYHNDITFLGKVADLKKLCNMDIRFDIEYTSMAPEQWFFFKPFESIKIFRDYFSINQGLNVRGGDLLSFYQKLFGSSFYKAVCSAYLSVLKKFFLCTETSPVVGKEISEDNFFDKDFLLEIGFIEHPMAKIPVFRNLDWKVGSGMNVFERYEDLLNFQMSEQYRHYFEELVTQYNGKEIVTLENTEDNMWSVSNDKDINVVGLSGSEHERKLESDINILRRQMGDLRRKLLECERRQNKV